MAIEDNWCFAMLREWNKFVHVILAKILINKTWKNASTKLTLKITNLLWQ